MTVFHISFQVSENIQYLKIAPLENGNMQRTRNSIYVTSTSSTDVLFHVLFCAMADNPELKEKALQNADKELSNFIQIYFSKGLTQQTYNARNQVLMKAFEIKHINNMKTLDCNSTVLYAANNIFKYSLKNFFVELACDCNEKTGQKVIQIDFDVARNVIAESMSCINCDKNVEVRSGEIMLIDGKNASMPFDAIPKAFVLADNVYSLFSIVEKNDTNDYILNVKRQNEKWYVFDCHSKNSLTKFQNRVMVVHLICYVLTQSEVISDIQTQEREIDVIQNFHVHRMNGTDISVEMACGPDSLLHCLCSLYDDKPSIFSEMNINKWLLMILKSYVDNKVDSLYYARIKLLLEIGFKFSANLSGKATIHCTSNIYSVLQMFNLNSSTETLVCGCRNKLKTIIAIEVNFEHLVKYGIAHLQSAILFSGSERLVQCNNCQGQQYIITRFSPIAFVDLQPINTSEKCVQLPTNSISTLPKRILLGEVNYELVGVIEFQPNSTGESHYIAHCRRNNTWMQFNDLMLQKSCSNESSKIHIHMLVYAIETIQ